MKAHFIGICGAGMSAVAKLLKEKGWQVTGSDEGFYPPISLYLEENDLPCTPHYSANNIADDVDVIVIGKHAKLVPEENEEVAAAFASGKPIKSFPEILNELTRDTKNFVVAGSFGKSTSVSLTAWALTYAGKDPSYFIGAVPLDLPSNAHSGKGGSFVLEGDEYPSANWDKNSKFLYYNPSTVLLISAEHDHVNVFPTIEDYMVPYVQLLLTVPQDGTIVACLDGEHVDDVVSKAGRTVITYSLRGDKGADWWPDHIERGTTTSFMLMFRNQRVAKITSSLLGDHNIQNMVGVAAWLLANDAITTDQLVSAFKEFKGVKRRMELKTLNTTIPVYEDFGSSRAKALAGLETIRTQFPTRRMIVLFEPHTFSFRNRAAVEWYDDLFNKADVIFVYQPPTHGAGTHDQLTQEEIVERVRATGKEVYAVKNKEELLEKLKPMLRPHHDVVLIETSGDLGGAIEDVASYVTKNFAG